METEFKDKQMLESGKYYKDTNGDKVGPIRVDGDWFDYLGSLDFFNEDGSSHKSCDPDLVSIADETKPMSEWNPQPGDVFGWEGDEYTFKNVIPDGKHFEGEYQCCDGIFDKELVSLVSRAAPTKFGDLTDAEKGAVLLARRNGETIEVYDDDGWSLAGVLLDFEAYRIKPKPVVVQFNDMIEVHGEDHKVYYSTIDGKVDWSTFTLIKE